MDVDTNVPTNFPDGVFETGPKPKTSRGKLIAGLIILLLIIAFPAVLFVAQTRQEIRQRASNTYPHCTNINPLDICSTKNAGDSCGAGMSCQNSETDGTCTCVSNTCPTGSTCNTGDACPNGQISHGSCANGGVRGTCCSPPQCVAPFCWNSSGAVACLSPMILVLNPLCIGGQECVCGTGGGTPSPTPTPTPAACAGGCTWKSDGTCNIGTCLGTCTRRTQFCESNTTPGVNCLPDQCISDNSCNASCTGGNNPSPTPTPTPAPLAQCTAVKIYQLTTSATCITADPTNIACWHLMTAGEISALHAGDTIYITTIGTVRNGPTIDRARIQVATNGNPFASWSQPLHETTTRKPKVIVTDPDEYFKAYTLPVGATNFMVGSEVYSPQFDTNTNPWDDGKGWR